MPSKVLQLAPRMSPDERRIIRNMHFENNMTPAEIAKATGRSLSAVCRLLARRSNKVRKIGRKRALTQQHVQRIVKKMEKMITQAKGEKEITIGMVREACKVKASIRTLQREFRAQGIYFRKLRQKPRLTPEDIKDRLAFATKYKAKSKQWWLKTLHMVIDLKNFSVYLTSTARGRAAMREVRGVYRKKGQGLNQGYTAVSKSLRHNPGARSVMIAAGVGKGKTLLWEPIKKAWCGAEAANLYSGPMLKALKRAYPGRAKFTVLEDNDPTGFRSKKGIQAKVDSGIKIFHIPKRSPDLNVCDYAIWRAVVRQMRLQEAQFPAAKRESRDEYISRLRKAATGLKKSFIDAAIGDMKRRCQRLFEAKGGFFEEGGKSAP
jgi:transposase